MRPSFGAGWIGFGVAKALRDGSMSSRNWSISIPLKVAEARLSGFDAELTPSDLNRCDLVVGASRAPVGHGGCACRTCAAAASWQVQVRAGSKSTSIIWKTAPAYDIHPSIRALSLCRHPQSGQDQQVCLVNDGYPANFIPGSGSVADEIVELILGELIVLMADLTTYSIRARHSPSGF